MSKTKILDKKVSMQKQKVRKMNLTEYARCIDCVYFGEHGAYCSLMQREEICASEACLFFQWKEQNKLREMDSIYFYPHYLEYQVEMKLRRIKVG